MTRHEAREALLCMLFDYSFNAEEKPDELLELYLENYYDKKEKCVCEELRQNNYFTQTYFGVIANIPEIDAYIDKCAEKWSTKRISRVSLSILRIAIYEILYVNDVPENVAINEAVELAKRFDNDDSYAFVNGVLGGVTKMIAEGKKPEADE